MVGMLRSVANYIVILSEMLKSSKRYSFYFGSAIARSFEARKSFVELRAKRVHPLQ